MITAQAAVAQYCMENLRLVVGTSDHKTDRTARKHNASSGIACTTAFIAPPRSRSAMISERKRKAAAPSDPAVCTNDSAAKQQVQGTSGDVRLPWKLAKLLRFVAAARAGFNTFDQPASF